MSFAIDTTFTAALIKAADALDTIEACRNHKLAPNARKHAMLVDTMKKAAQRLQDLAGAQSVYPPEVFFKLAFERLALLRAERAAVLKFKREQREAREAERALIMIEEGLLAQAA